MDEIKYRPESELEVVYGYNNTPLCPPRRDYDTLCVYGVTGKVIGFTWNYGDSVELDISLNDTILHSDREHLGLFAKYLDGKEVEINLTNNRGEVKYTFYVKASLHTKIRLNCSEETMVERGEYSCNLVLVNPYDMSRINLIETPYSVYVR